MCVTTPFSARVKDTEPWEGRRSSLCAGKRQHPANPPKKQLFRVKASVSAPTFSPTFPAGGRRPQALEGTPARPVARELRTRAACRRWRGAHRPLNNLFSRFLSPPPPPRRSGSPGPAKPLEDPGVLSPPGPGRSGGRAGPEALRRVPRPH